MASPQLETIRLRAGEACEYCHLPVAVAVAPFAIDHIIARQHGGSNHIDNLALACDRCNLHKGPNIAGIDFESGSLTRLFHPRTDNWDEHFEWSGHLLVGKTAIGRTTVHVLAINEPITRSIRAALMAEGIFPPIRGS